MERKRQDRQTAKRGLIIFSLAEPENLMTVPVPVSFLITDRGKTVRLPIQERDSYIASK
jgi:hypothetical protein